MNFMEHRSEKTRLCCSYEGALKIESSMHIVQTAIFSPSEEITTTVPVEIDRRGTHVVPFDVSIGKWTDRLEVPWGLAG